MGHTLVYEPPGNYLVGVGWVILPGHGDILVAAEEGALVNINPVGEDDGNLWTLCIECHKIKTESERRRESPVR